MASHPVFYRFPISDKNNEYFLLQVIPTQGSKNPLDLRLLGTESTAAYEAKLRHRRVEEWKDVPGHCSNDEWEQILIAAFIEPTNPHRKDIEIKVEVKTNAATLIIRKNIAGIIQRLGSIKLDAFDIVYNSNGSDNGPQLFDWCVAAIGDRAKVVDDLAIATAKAAELEKSAKELRSQLEDLIQAKEDDEKHLLEKFRDLLNEKKLKIRQQQRLLASADVDPAKLENVGASQNTVRKAKASRDGKRKTTQEADNESDDGFEKMDVDDAAAIKEESGDDPEMDMRQTTDEELEDATASEAEDTDEEPQPAGKEKGKSRSRANAKTVDVDMETDEEPQPAATGRGKGRAKTKSTAKSTSTRNTKASTASRNRRSAKGKNASPPSEGAEDGVTDEPPPRRTLPFQSRNKPKEKTPEPAKVANNDETASDDDEL